MGGRQAIRNGLDKHEIILGTMHSLAVGCEASRAMGPMHQQNIGHSDREMQIENGNDSEHGNLLRFTV